MKRRSPSSRQQQDNLFLFLPKKEKGKFISADDGSLESPVCQVAVNSRCLALAFLPCLFSPPERGMKLKMNERHVRSDEMVGRGGRVSLWSPRSERERLSRAVMKGREMDCSTQERISARAQLSSTESQQGENHFSFRFNILSAQTRTSDLSFFFLLFCPSCISV